MAGFYNVVAADVAPVIRNGGPPLGFDSTPDFLADMREKFDEGVGFDEHNTRAGKQDAKFVVGDQWDAVVKARREELKKPVLTFNRLLAFVSQIIGNRLMNETEIRVNPDKGGTKEIAAIREGVIRNIFKNSNAQFARDEAQKYQVIGGQGVFVLTVDYVSDDVFEQEIKIDAVADPYSAVFDPLGIEPSGGDCEWAFISEDIPQQVYKKRYPKADATSFADSDRWNTGGMWITAETIRVVSFWQMVTEGEKLLALYTDGTVHDVTDLEEFEWAPFVDRYPSGEPYVREVPNRFCRKYICSGNDILEGPFDYQCSSLPVYRVPGWEVTDGEKRHRWGLVRPLKDPQRLHNYWRSVQAEALVAAPRNKWLATPEAVKGHEATWRAAATNDDPFLYYNDESTPPTHIPPPGIDPGLISESNQTNQDLKDISNIHEAALGMPSNEVSKVAIQQRQMVSDVGTFIYSDRQRAADERCAKNINELFPHYYDTKRTVTIMGTDDKVQLQVINDPSNPNTDVTLGKYGVTVSVGPASETKRTLAAEQMMAFVNAAPQSAAIVMDLVAEAQDWPMASEFARRFKLTLPPGMIPPDEMTPEMVAMQQNQQQNQQMQQQVQTAEMQAKLSQLAAKAAADYGRAALARAQAYQAIMDANARDKDVESKVDDRNYSHVLKTLDQHNDLEAEDRDFALRATETLVPPAPAPTPAPNTPPDTTGEPQ